MTQTALADLVRAWTPISAAIRAPHTDDEYEAMCGLIYDLLEIVHDGDTGPEADLLYTLTLLAEAYEEEYHFVDSQSTEETD